MGVTQDYLEVLHANHEDWLRAGTSISKIDEGHAWGERWPGGQARHARATRLGLQPEHRPGGGAGAVQAALLQ